MEGINQYSLSVTEYLISIAMDAKELLDKYVNRELSTNEREEVKRLIRTDAEFKKEFVREKAMSAAVQARKKAALRNELKGFLKNVDYGKEESTSTLKQEQPKKAKVINMQPRRIIMAIAASLTLLLVSYLALNDQTEYDKLYAENYRVYTNGISIVRGDNTDVFEGGNAYVNGDYQQAVTLFTKALTLSDEELAQEKFTRDGIYHYLGHAYLNLQQYENAKDAFEKVLTFENTQYLHDVQWYLGLTYLKLKDKESARKAFEGITEKKTMYTPDAKNIIEEL